MAERIDTFSKPPRTGGRPALYPWPEWMDGSTWRIVQGEDFKVPATSMAQTIRVTAWRRGVPVRVFVHGDSVEFQFTPQAEEAA